MTRRYGFTLIELLIVVAIIAILAAIAVPNFLEAQTRAKISRVRGELRTIAVGIEAYTVDNNRPVPVAGDGPYDPARGVFQDLTFGNVGGQTGILTPSITTPVAYLTTFDFEDPFISADRGFRADLRLYSYKAYQWEWPQGAPSPGRDDSQAIRGSEGAMLNGAKFKELYGSWRLFSIGPDKRYGNKFTDTVNTFSNRNVGMIYDGTNGTISEGNIIRSQKEGDQQTMLHWYP
jgi:prepilin-type N-terminal cleavage/methylation domain-containing protein